MNNNYSRKRYERECLLEVINKQLDGKSVDIEIDLSSSHKHYDIRRLTFVSKVHILGEFGDNQILDITSCENWRLKRISDALERIER